MLKINSELPLCMFGENYKLNDFDFVLFHLYHTIPEYKQYYNAMRLVHPERTMILDNSAYEFFVKGETLDMDAFAECIRELKPTYYILPDVLMDKEATLAGVCNFRIKYDFPDSKPMAVLQGNSVNDFSECATFYYGSGIKAICIPFHNSFFKDLGAGEDIPRIIRNIIANEYPTSYGITDDMKYALGRMNVVQLFRNELHNFDYVHMLGSHCPVEAKFYSRLTRIDSMDTGYPVKLGYENQTLGWERSKPTTIIDDFIQEDLPFEKLYQIGKNLEIFKKYSRN